MTTTDLVHVEPLLPMDPEVATVAMAKYRALTTAMLTDEDWQTIPNGRFVKRSGFQKIASGYGISTEILSEHVDRGEAGEPLRASATVRATHPTGRYADGSGRCSIDESRFKSGSGKAKAEHDIAATAVTRATNRAISNLVGFGQVSAEEVDGVDPNPTAGHPSPWGPIATDKQENAAAAAVKRIAPGVDAERFILLLGQGFDGVPEAAVKALTGLAKYVAATEAPPPENAPSAGSAYHDPPDDAVYPPGHYQGD